MILSWTVIGYIFHMWRTLYANLIGRIAFFTSENIAHIEFYLLALINRARGLYGRILTEVVSTDRKQWGLYTRPRSRFSHTDRFSSVNKMFIIWRKQEEFNSFNVTGLCELRWRRWAEYNSSKVFSSSFLVFSHQLFGTYRNKYC